MLGNFLWPIMPGSFTAQEARRGKRLSRMHNVGTFLHRFFILVALLPSRQNQAACNHTELVLPTDHLIPLRNGPALAGRPFGLYPLLRKGHGEVAENLARCCGNAEFAEDALPVPPPVMIPPNAKGVQQNPAESISDKNLTHGHPFHCGR